MFLGSFIKLVVDALDNKTPGGIAINILFNIHDDAIRMLMICIKIFSFSDDKMVYNCSMVHDLVVATPDRIMNKSTKLQDLTMIK